MRILAIALAFAIVAVAAPVLAKQKAVPEFPVPKDAGKPEEAPGGGGKIVVYKIPRERDVVVTEVREALAKGGWKITKDEKSPRGNAIRLEVEKDGIKYGARFTANGDNETALILTLP